MPPRPTRLAALEPMHRCALQRASVDLCRVALLDGSSGRVKALLPNALMQPELVWERVGDVNDVVFVQGAHRRDDGAI